MITHKTKEDISMKFELAKSGNLLIVRVAGELDHHFADEIRMRIDAEIMKPPVTNILFDFNNLSFMDSSGIGLILGRQRIMESFGGGVAVKNPSPSVRRIIQVAGLSRLIISGKNTEDKK